MTGRWISFWNKTKRHGGCQHSSVREGSLLLLLQLFEFFLLQIEGWFQPSIMCLPRTCDFFWWFVLMFAFFCIYFKKGQWNSFSFNGKGVRNKPEKGLSTTLSYTELFWIIQLMWQCTGQCKHLSSGAQNTTI